MQAVLTVISHACPPATVSLADVSRSDIQGRQDGVQIPPPQELLTPTLSAPQLVNHTGASGWVKIHQAEAQHVMSTTKQNLAF